MVPKRSQARCHYGIGPTQPANYEAILFQNFVIICRAGIKQYRHVVKMQWKVYVWNRLGIQIPEESFGWRDAWQGIPRMIRNPRHSLFKSECKNAYKLSKEGPIFVFCQEYNIWTILFLLFVKLCNQNIIYLARRLNALKSLI